MDQVRKRTISLSSSSESSEEDDEDEAGGGEDARMLRKSKRSSLSGVKLRKCPVCKIEVGPGIRRKKNFSKILMPLALQILWSFLE